MWWSFSTPSTTNFLNERGGIDRGAGRVSRKSILSGLKKTLDGLLQRYVALA
jgi:hypothetical protein